MDKLSPRHPNTSRNMTTRSTRSQGRQEIERKFAQPINYAYLSTPTTGVKKRVPKSPTVSIGPELKTEIRNEERRTSKQRLFRSGSLRVKSDQTPSKQRQRTIPQPFQFMTDRIHAREEEKRRKMMEEDEAKRKAAMQFKSLGMPDFNNMPVFCPKLGDPKKTEPMKVVFQSDHRAETWKQLDALKRQQEDECKRRMRQLEEDRKREQEEETRKMRQTMVHRARPVPKSKPFQITRDLGHVTVPEAPALRLDRRLQDRQRRL